jgi:hypothetical protein
VQCCYAALHTVSFVHGCFAEKSILTFSAIEILQGRWQHGEKVGYCYPSGLEKTLCKWDVYVPLVTKGLNYAKFCINLLKPTGHVMREQVFTFNNCTLCPHCLYVFCIYLRTNCDLCNLQHKLIGFYNRDGKCLQRGTDWVFKQSGLRYVCKGLNLQSKITESVITSY